MDHWQTMWLGVLSSSVLVLWRHAERLHKECRDDREKLWESLFGRVPTDSRGHRGKP